MAQNKKKDFFDALSLIEMSYPGVMNALHNCGVKPLSALAVGYVAYSAPLELSAEQQEKLDKMERIKSSMAELDLPTADLDKQIAQIKGTPETTAWTAYKSHMSANGSRATSRATYNLVGKVVSLPFSRLGAFYRFVSVSNDVWYLYAMNNGSRRVDLVLSSADLDLPQGEGLVEGKTAQVTSPTMARKIAKVWTGGYNGNEPGTVSAIVAGFNANWDKVNAGGIGTTDKVQFGSYAILFEIPANTWLKRAKKDGKMPRSQEIEVKQPAK
jgi:hypothetical protein